VAGVRHLIWDTVHGFELRIGIADRWERTVRDALQVLLEVSETRAAQATTRVPEAAARSERYTLAIELDVASRNLGLKSQLSRSYSNGSLHYMEGQTEKL
jgi:hypothetical protein